jgi:hypothetical protein
MQGCPQQNKQFVLQAKSSVIQVSNLKVGGIFQQHMYQRPLVVFLLRPRHQLKWQHRQELLPDVSQRNLKLKCKVLQNERQIVTNSIVWCHRVKVEPTTLIPAIEHDVITETRIQRQNLFDTNFITLKSSIYLMEVSIIYRVLCNFISSTKRIANDIFTYPRTNVIWTHWLHSRLPNGRLVTHSTDENKWTTLFCEPTHTKHNTVVVELCQINQSWPCNE